MTYQTQFNGTVAYKIQSALGTQATGSGAKVLRLTGGQGGRLTKAAVESNEVRRDGMRTRGRHGTQKTQGAYSSEVSLSFADDILQAVMRGTYGSADLAITQADVTSITVTSNTIVATSGSWISLGLKNGDVVRLTDHSDATNNNKDIRLTNVTATTLTTAETLTAAGADASFTLTRTGRVLINPAAGSLVERYFTIDEHEIDIDGSEVFTDCKWGSLKFSMQADGLLTMDTTWVGTGQFTTLDGSNAPHFASPTESTGSPFSVVDATIRYGSSDLVDLTSFDLTLDIAPVAPVVFGSGAIKYSPDVFSGSMGIGMNLTMLRSSLAQVANLVNETQLSLHVLAVEGESEPKDFLSIYVPNFTLGGVDKSALSKQGGPRTQTITVPQALIGIDSSGGAADSCMLKFQVSNSS